MDQQVFTVNPYEAGDKVLVFGNRTTDSVKVCGQVCTVSRAGDNGPGRGWIYVQELEKNSPSGIWITDIKMDTKEWD